MNKDADLAWLRQRHRVEFLAVLATELALTAPR